MTEVKKLQIALLLIFFSFFVSGFQITSFAGYGVTLQDFALLSFYFIVFKHILWDGEEIKFSITPPLVFILAVFATVFLSGIHPLFEGRSDWIIQYFKTSIHFYFLAGFALLASVYPIDIKNWSNVIRLWLIIALIINVFGIYQIIARAADLPLAWIDFTNVSLARGASEGPPDEIKQLSLRYGNFFRATSIFSEPSALGSFNSYIFAFLVLPFVYKLKHWITNKTFIITTLVFTAIGTLATFSLTAMVGVAMIFSAFLLMQKVRHIFRFILIFISIVIVIVIADSIFSKNLGISVVELFSKRIEGILNISQGDDKMVIGESFNVRRASARKAIEVWEEYPVFGIGAGLSYKNKINNLEFSDFTVFGLLAEYGMLGLLAFLAFFTSLVMIAYRLAREQHNDEHLSNEEKLMKRIPFFIMVVLFLINFISGNNFVLMNDWGPMAIVMAVINFNYLKNNRNVVSFRLVKYPLKELFRKNLQN